jgi:serine/threonine protein kinase
MSTVTENPNVLVGREFSGYKLLEYLDKGKIGVVYRAQNTQIENDVVACKVIPTNNLKAGWEIELQKAVRLHGIAEIVQYRQHFASVVDGVLHAFIIWEYVAGSSLRKYSHDHPAEITLPFIKNLILQILRAFYAMEEAGVTHGDLHEGNILIARDPRVPDYQPRIRITDFGIGSTSSAWKPTDDYSQLAIICHRLLSDHIDSALLDSSDRRLYDALTHDFLRKISEKDPTIGSYVRNPGELLVTLNDLGKAPPAPALKLDDPFDYLSCEQIGDSFDLLQLLYSQSFPGYTDLTQRTNTVLTGPRGCGKTTIFRNLSLKTRILAGKLELNNLDTFIGIYYQCSDLYYAFPYLENTPTDEDRRIISHYFNLGILYEILDTISSLETIPELALSPRAFATLEAFLRGFITTYEPPPKGTDIANHLKSVVGLEKARVKAWLDMDRKGDRPEVLLPIDFLKRLCRLLQTEVPWLSNRAFYFFIDDYSLPRISQTVQMSLSDFIFDRNSECFFKISTESITTLFTVDSHGKLLEETREYDMIDLGSYFLHASSQRKGAFLREIVNNRLSYATKRYLEGDDISAVLGDAPFKSDNELARAIRESSQRVFYFGWPLVVNLCSGDIAIFLRLIRDILSLCRDQLKTDLVSRAPGDLQHRAIISDANDFLNRIESAPETGQRLRKITEAFGNVANWYLVNLDSGNVKQNPPWQAFRVEIRDRPTLNGETLKIYNDLIKYGIFLRDVRGKSQRGAVVPRLYLRRLLIPSFRLTPSQRDAVSVDSKEFVMLLQDPEGFRTHMKKKPRRPRADRKQMKLG